MHLTLVTLKLAMATFISVVIPWCIVLPFQTGFWLNIFTNWASLLFISTANFILPFWLFCLSQWKAKGLQTLELAREAVAFDSNEKYHDRFYNPRKDLPEKGKEKPSYQKHLEKHLQTLKKQTLEDPQLEKLKRPKMYRHMSADAVQLEDLSDILNPDNNDHNNNVPPVELSENEKSLIPSHPSTPRSASTDDEEFYHLFSYSGGKPFKAFPGKTKNFAITVSFLSGLVSIILISGVIVYDFIGLANGRNYFDLDINT